MEFLVAIASMIDMMNIPNIPDIVSEVKMTTEYVDINSLDVVELFKNEDLTTIKENSFVNTANSYEKKNHLTIGSVPEPMYDGAVLREAEPKTEEQNPIQNNFILESLTSMCLFVASEIFFVGLATSLKTGDLTHLITAIGICGNILVGQAEFKHDIVQPKPIIEVIQEEKSASDIESEFEELQDSIQIYEDEKKEIQQENEEASMYDDDYGDYGFDAEKYEQLCKEADQRCEDAKRQADEAYEREIQEAEDKKEQDTEINNQEYIEKNEQASVEYDENNDGERYKDSLKQNESEWRTKNDEINKDYNENVDRAAENREKAYSEADQRCSEEKEQARGECYNYDSGIGW